MRLLGKFSVTCAKRFLFRVHHRFYFTLHFFLTTDISVSHLSALTVELFLKFIYFVKNYIFYLIKIRRRLPFENCCHDWQICQIRKKECLFILFALYNKLFRQQYAQKRDYISTCSVHHVGALERPNSGYEFYR